jgi:CubicO group peptidase (beta-lactamase class C family)
VVALAQFRQPPTAPLTRSYLAEAGTPALALGLADGRRVLRREVDGVRVQGQPGPAAVGDAWELGSASKSLTAALAAVLVQEDRLRWSTRVLEVLPGLQGARDAYAQVTLEQLLSHHAGIPALDPAAPDLPAFTGDLHHMRVQAVQWLLSQPPAAAPGKAFHYSNEGYLVAAAMMEEILGQTGEQAGADRVLAPLGLQARPGPPGPREPWGHSWKDQAWQPQDPAAPPGPLAGIMAPGSGLLSMTLDSVLGWAQANLRGLRGEPCAALTSDSFRKLQTPHDPNGYALGWVQDRLNGRPVLWHSGSTGTFASYIILDPDRDRALVLLANGETPQGEVPRRLAELAREILD